MKEFLIMLLAVMTMFSVFAGIAWMAEHKEQAQPENVVIWVRKWL